MYKNLFFFLISILYKYLFPIYRFLYFRYKFNHDNFEIHLFKRWVKQGNIVLDIGANIGFYSILFSRLVDKRGQVHCFEPEKLNYKHLKESTKNLKNIILNNLAVSNSNQPLKLYISKHLNVDHKIYQTEDWQSIYEVKSTTIDHYIKNRFKVDIAKIDIQGADFFALQGMKKTIVKNSNIVIMMEYWPWGIDKLGINVNEIISFVNALDCKIYVVKGKEIKMLNNSTFKKYKEYKKDDFDNWIITRRPLKDLLNSDN